MSFSLEKEVSIDFDVVCSSCGNSLDVVDNIKKGRYEDYYEIRVGVCESCLSKKDDEIEDLKSKIKELEELEGELRDKIAALEVELTFNKIINENQRIDNIVAKGGPIR